MNVLFETALDGAIAKTHDWLTPPEILSALGEFDLDPCASQQQPWRTAKTEYTIEHNGLSKEWSGRVWCNPPYGPFASQWLARCANHGDAIAFVFARTDTAMFHEHVWPKASSLYFLKGRVAFRTAGGSAARSGRKCSAGAPSVLIAYGERNSEKLKSCAIPGAFVNLKH